MLLVIKSGHLQSTFLSNTTDACLSGISHQSVKLIVCQSVPYDPVGHEMQLNQTNCINALVPLSMDWETKTTNFTPQPFTYRWNSGLIYLACHASNSLLCGKVDFVWIGVAGSRGFLAGAGVDGSSATGTHLTTHARVLLGRVVACALAGRTGSARASRTRHHVFGRGLLARAVKSKLLTARTCGLFSYRQGAALVEYSSCSCLGDKGWNPGRR